MNKKGNLIIIGISTVVIISTGVFVTSASAKKQDALIKMVEESSTKIEEDYTEESWNNFEDSLEIAKNILNQNKVNSSEVNIAYKNLSKKIDDIVKLNPEEKAKKAQEAKESEEAKKNENNVIVVKKPMNIKAESESTSINISWEAPENIVGLVEYIIYIDGKLLDTIDSSNTSYKVEDLRTNTIYGFRVVSKYSNGEISNPASVNARTKK